MKVKGRLRVVRFDDSIQEQDGICRLSLESKIKKIKAVGDIKAKQIDVVNAYFKGRINIQNIETKELYIIGEITARKIFAEKFMCEFSGNSTAEVITANKVYFKPEDNDENIINNFIGRMLGRKIPTFTMHKNDNFKICCINADDVFIQNTEVDYVAGKRIVIGKHSAVKEVVYTESLKVFPNASVENIKRVSRRRL